jgi:hypothetical protein
VTTLRPPHPKAKPSGDIDPPPRLPIRWAIVFLAAVVVGVPIGLAAGVAAGVAAVIALATFLHEVLD